MDKMWFEVSVKHRGRMASVSVGIGRTLPFLQVPCFHTWKRLGVGGRRTVLRVPAVEMIVLWGGVETP